MKFSSLTARIGGKSAAAWEVHFDALARVAKGEDIIILSVGEELSQPTPQLVVDAAVQSLRAGRHHYPPVNGELALRQAIARRHHAATGQAVTAAQCTVFAGAQNALFAVAQVLLEHGDEVLLMEPYYTTYAATFAASGASLVSVPVTAAHNFQLNPAAILDKITPRTRAMVLNSPNNPLGTVYTQDQFAALMAVCVERDIWLLSDEVYREILPPAARYSPASLPGADKVCVTISSVSKSHRMTGWRLGWAIAPPQLTAHLYNLCICMSYGLPPFIMDAALAALQHGNATAAAVRADLHARRQCLQQILGEVPGLRLLPAEGGMFVVMDIRALPLSTQQFARQLLEHYHVSVLPCDGFGAAAKGLLRLSLCVDAARLRRACHRIADFVQSRRVAA